MQAKAVQCSFNVLKKVMILSLNFLTNNIIIKEREYYFVLVP